MTGICKIIQYWKDGIRIDALDNGKEIEYFAMMSVNTPAGQVNTNPKIEATTIEEAYDKVQIVIDETLEKIKAEVGKKKLVLPNADHLKLVK